MVVPVPIEDTWVIHNVVSSSTGPFAFTFRNFEKADVQVLVDDVALADSAWSYTPGSLIEYGGYSGGSVTLVTAVENAKVTIARMMDAERDSNVTGAQMTAAAINTRLNEHTMHLQDLRRDFGRAVLAVFGATGASFTAADVAAIAAIATEIEQVADIDTEVIAVANALTYIQQVAAALPLSPDVSTRDTLADLQALSAPSVSGVQISTHGRLAIDDGGGGDFVWISGDQTANVSADEVGSGLGDGGIWIAPTSDLTGASGAWKRLYTGRVQLEWYGGGAGDADNDQAAMAAVASQGLEARLNKGVAYKMTTGLTPANGFGLHFEPLSKISLVTQASGSGSAGFKNYSGATGDRNSTDGTAFMMSTASATFNFTGDVWFDGDGANQPILRPVLAQGCYLNIFGRFRVTNLNACNGALSLNEMLGGHIEDVDVRGAADMVDSAYTNLTNFSPAGVTFDDVGTDRSSRISFNRVFVADLNRDAAGSDPFESDGVTIGGIDKALVAGGTEGHVFSSIEVHNMGEGLDIQQSKCVVRSLVTKDITLFPLKFIHGAQYNRVDHVDIDGYGAAAINFAGSDTSSTDTNYNSVGGGMVRRGGKVGTSVEVSAVLFTEDTTADAAFNIVRLEHLAVDADTDYIAKDNHTTTARKNRVWIKDVVGTPNVRPASVAANDNLALRVAGSLARMTMSANQTPITSATNTVVTFDTVDEDLLGEVDTANNKVRCMYPGPKGVRGKVRASLNASDDVIIRILKNSNQIAQTQLEAVSGGTEQTYEVAASIMIDENEAGTASADLQVEVRITSAGTITILNTAIASVFEVHDLAA